MPWSDAVRVSLHPRGAYADLALAPEPHRFLELPCLGALLLGVVFAVADSDRPSLRLVLGCAVAWSFVPALQIGAVCATFFAFAGRRVALGRAIHLHFLGHLPWSLWLLAIATIASAIAAEREGSLWKILATAAVPFLWSRVIGWHFFRRVYGLGRGGALVASFLHLAIGIGPIALFFFATGQLAPRIMGGR